MTRKKHGRQFAHAHVIALIRNVMDDVAQASYGACHTHDNPCAHNSLIQYVMDDVT